MIGYLEGTVLEKLPDSLLLLTVTGVGYQVFVPLSLLGPVYDQQHSLRLYVATVVRDNEIALYGFDRLDAKRLFELLLKASGIGPKLALAILSSYPPAELRLAIMRQDVALLSTIPGVGKKTAARLCVELSDRLARDAGTRPEAMAGGNELISALTNLGFPEKDVVLIVRQLSGEDAPFTDLLKKALALLGKHQR